MRFEFSGSLLRYVGYARSCSYESETLKGAFDQLRSSYPALNKVLFSSDGMLSRAHQLFINGTRVPPDQLADPALLGTRLAKGDTVSILTIITGG